MRSDIESWLSKNRKDLWGLHLTLKYATDYKEGTWALLSDEDKDMLTRAANK